jgi:hypothetical protein
MGRRMNTPDGFLSAPEKILSDAALLEAHGLA